MTTCTHCLFRSARTLLESLQRNAVTLSHSYTISLSATILIPSTSPSIHSISFTSLSVALGDSEAGEVIDSLIRRLKEDKKLLNKIKSIFERAVNVQKNVYTY